MTEHENVQAKMMAEQSQTPRLGRRWISVKREPELLVRWNLVRTVDMIILVAALIEDWLCIAKLAQKLVRLHGA